MFYKDELAPEDSHNTSRHTLLHPDAEKEDRRAEPKIALEYTVPTSQKLMALGIYFFCNVGLTLYNKAVLGSVSQALQTQNELLLQSLVARRRNSWKHKF